MSAKHLLDEALTLPVKERARLAHELIRSLEREGAEDPDAVAAAWDDEIVRRAREIKAGTAKTESWLAVESRIKRQLRKPRPGGSKSR